MGFVVLRCLSMGIWKLYFLEVEGWSVIVRNDGRTCMSWNQWNVNVGYGYGHRNRNGVVDTCYIVISFLTLVLGLEEISDESKQVTS